MQNMGPQPEDSPSLLKISRQGLRKGTCWVKKQGNDSRSWDELVQHLQQLRADLHTQTGHARDVAARSVQAGDKSKHHRVGPYPEYDRDRTGCPLRGQCRLTAIDRGNNSHLTANEFGRQFRHPIVLAIRPTIFDRHVPALDMAGFVEALAERAQQVRMYVWRRAVEEPDHRHRRLLRARRERPCRRAAEKANEFTSFHSITSSLSD